MTNALGARQDKNGSLRLEPHTQAHSGPSSIHHSRAHRRTAPSHHIVPPATAARKTTIIAVTARATQAAGLL